MTLREHWTLDPAVTFLNHGSFGACPRAVLEHQQQLRARLESEPVRFMVRELPALLEDARRRLAAFVGADADDLGFVRNATSGVNAVLRSLTLNAGDELLITDQAYPACRNALEFVAERSGARIVVATLPFVGATADTVVDAVLSRVGARTRLALIDHVTSPTGMVLPLSRLVAQLQARGVDTLVDGAHAPGMLPVDLNTLGAAYYAANCHKWICAPKGAAFLHVRRDRQRDLHPLTISHGFRFPAGDRSRFRMEFDWQGTDDPTPWLCVPAALDTVGSMVDGGWSEVWERNRSLALQARGVLCETLSVDPPTHDELLGTLVAVPLPDGEDRPQSTPLYLDPLQDSLLFEHGIEVPVVPWPAPPKRLLRVSAQLYNEPGDYEKLAEALRSTLHSTPGGP